MGRIWIKNLGQPGYWINGKGEEVPLSRMSKVHLERTRDMLMNMIDDLNIEQLPVYETKIREINAELVPLTAPAPEEAHTL